jgi:polysaccharide pyruvyl transferase WcaK-like protein
MRIHHFYPRTKNIGDHFVQIGIQKLVREINPGAHFELFDVNSRGSEIHEYGLTRKAIERANKEADLVIVGGSNLYEGGFRWPLGIHLDPNALQDLRVPLVLLGIGTGSNFGAPVHRPSRRAVNEIKQLNERATLSAVRDATTLSWLRQIGVNQAKLLGDPATCIFNREVHTATAGSHVLIILPPHRVWASKRGFWKALTLGRPIFRALVDLTKTLLEKGEEIRVVCNDPLELPLARKLFGRTLPHPILCPTDPDDYFELLAKSRFVVTGRLHTAAVALSLAVPFLLIDIDQRTRGFLDTYELAAASVQPDKANMSGILLQKTLELMDLPAPTPWLAGIERRNFFYKLAVSQLEIILKANTPETIV